ncbi:MAG: protein kinase, partial [Lentisphaeraceae bacterium]|nr:protein kinase [Lentisphaeraceae bacterium]
MTPANDNNSKDEYDFLSSFYDEAYDPPQKAPTEVSKDRYKILELIDEGSSKKILKVEDTLTRRVLAMATLKQTSAPQLELFEREARLTASLQHPHILPVYDIGTHEKYGPYFTTKLIQGMSLRQLLQNLHDGHKQIQTNQRLEIFLKICDAISYVHSRGVLHLDLKPENIHISDYGEVLVLDWGLAKIQDSLVSDEFIDSYSFDKIEQKYLTLRGRVKGTPGYLAPEQCSKSAQKSHLTDIYSLGVILYELVTLEALITGDTHTLIDKTSRGDLAFQSKLLTPGLEAIIRRAVAFTDEQRYQQVNALSSDIQAYHQGFAPQAEQAGVLRELRLFTRRHQRLFLTSLFFILSLVASTAFYINNISQTLLKLQQSQQLIKYERKQKDRFKSAAQPQIIEDIQLSLKVLDWSDALQKAQQLNDISQTEENQNLLATLYLLNYPPKHCLTLLKQHNSQWSQLLSTILRSDYTDNSVFKQLNNDSTTKTLLLLSHFILTDKFPLQSLSLLTKWQQVTDTQWLVKLAATVKQNQRKLILSRIHTLLKNSLWPARALIAAEARLISTDKELQKQFAIIEATNLALMQRVSSSVENQKPASAAVDGNLTTFWSVASTPAMLSLDLGATHEIGKILLNLYAAGNRYYQYQILASEDQLNYQVIVDQSKNKKTAKKDAEVFHFPAIKVRYLKFHMLYNSANPGQHIREIKVFKAYKNLARQAVLHSPQEVIYLFKLTDGNCERKQFCTLQEKSSTSLDFKELISASQFYLYLQHQGTVTHQFTIEVSLDGKNWRMLCDESENKKI